MTRRALLLLLLPLVLLAALQVAWEEPTGNIQGRAISTTAPTTNQVLKFDGTQYAPAADADTITRIYAGTGVSLSGGPTGDVTVTSTAAGGDVTITPGANVTVNGGTDPVTATTFTIAATGGGSTGAGGPTTGAYTNLVVTAYDTHTVTVTCDGLTLNSTVSTSPLWASSINQVADIEASGLNGLDAGTEAVSTWYSVWVVGKGGSGVATSTGVVLSTRTDAPNLPATYTHYRRVGWVRNDGSGNTWNFQRHGSFVQPTYALNSILSGANNSNRTVADASASFPPTCRLGSVAYNLLSGALFTLDQANYTGDGIVAVGVNRGVIPCQLSATQTLLWKSTGVCDVGVCNYWDPL